MIDEKTRELLKYYNEGLTLYKKKQFDEAKVKFKKCLEIKPDDGPSQIYFERSEFFTVSPPRENWDGVFVMNTK